MASLLQLEFATIMAPANQTWWWYPSVLSDQIGQLVTNNKAMLTSIRAYVDIDNTVKFALIMAPANQAWWWYTGVTGAQVTQYLNANKARLTDISAYIDTDHQLKYAVIMVPADQTWWWYPDSPADQVAANLNANKARLTAISPFLDTSNNLKYAVIMAPADQTWWWYPESPADQVAANLNANKARLTVLSPVVVPPPEITWNFGTGSGTTSSGATECAYTLNLTLQSNGTCHFWGSYTNRGDVPIITAPAQTFGVSIVVLDANGNGYSFSAGGQVPSAPQSGSTYTWDQTTNSSAIAANWRAVAARNDAQYGYHNQSELIGHT